MKKFLHKLAIFFNVCPFDGRVLEKFTTINKKYCYYCFRLFDLKKKKYRYRVRASWKIKNYDIDCTLTWGNYKYYWVAVFRKYWYKFWAFVFQEGDKIWISKEEIGRKRNKANKMSAKRKKKS